MATRSCVPSARTQSVKRLAQSVALRFQLGRRAALCASHSSSALSTDWGPINLHCAVPRPRVNMASMKKQIPTQLFVGLGILLVGGGIILGEYFLVRWYPAHRAGVIRDTLRLTPFKNDGLGVEMQVAAGIDEKVEAFSGGVRIYSPRFWSTGPSITVTSEPNPDHSGEFTPQTLATWQTDGVQHGLLRYTFEHTRINDRDAVLIWQYEHREMVLTARVISPDRIIEASCTPGSADESLYTQACDESVRSLTVEGPPSPQPPVAGIEEVAPSKAPAGP